MYWFKVFVPGSFRIQGKDKSPEPATAGKEYQQSHISPL